MTDREASYSLNGRELVSCCIFCRKVRPSFPSHANPGLPGTTNRRGYANYSNNCGWFGLPVEICTIISNGNYSRKSATFPECADYYSLLCYTIQPNNARVYIAISDEDYRIPRVPPKNSGLGRNRDTADEPKHYRKYFWILGSFRTGPAIILGTLNASARAHGFFRGRYKI